MTRERFTALMICTMLVLSGAGLWRMAHAQNVNRAASDLRHDNSRYKRPEPLRPLKPTVPGANRYQSDKVFLEKADSLYKRGNDTVERQIVSGEVVFRHGPMWMYCDSAFYYPDRNGMDAFGHVRMVQGDTLEVKSDKLFYDGDAGYARLVNGPSQQEVRLRDSKGTLITDTLHYYVNDSRGYYDSWGVLDDGVNSLRSDMGIYDTDTKDAQFFYNVKLENPGDGYSMLTDTLYYNTADHIARIESVTDIFGPSDTIRATRGWYNTASDSLELTARAIIAHTDSLGRTTTLEGDSIIHDKKSRISRAYRFSTPGRGSAPVVLNDTANHTTLIADYAWYNDSTRAALATRYPMMMEYSRGDTIFLRADTIFTYVRDIRDMTVRQMTDTVVGAEGDTVVSVRPDTIWSLPREIRVAEAFRRARFFGKDIQGVADSIIASQADSTVHMIRRPIAWSENRQVSGREIIVHFNDSSADRAFIPADAKVMEHVEADFYNQIAGKIMTAYLDNGTLRHLDVDGNVQLMFLPEENDSTISRLVFAESGWMSVDMNGKELDNLKMWPDVSGTVTPVFLIKKTEQKRLPGFIWYEAIRPRRAWYDGRLVWDDDLGELSEELEEYFNKP